MSDTPSPLRPGTKRNLPALTTASSTRIKPAGNTRRMPTATEGPVVVSSVDDSERDLSRVRQRVHGGSRLRPHGLSLRLKIVLAMAGVTVVTALLIFVAVNSKAVSQLNDEIDKKGVRLVKTLSTIDPTYWMYAIHQSKDDRRVMADQLLKELFGANWSDSARSDIFRQQAELKRIFDQVTDRVGVEKKDSGQRLLSGLYEELQKNDKLGEDGRKHLHNQYQTVLKEERWQRRWQALVDPLGTLEPLKADARDVGKGTDILNITVQDVTISPTEGPGVQAVDSTRGQTVVFDTSTTRQVTGVQVSEGSEKSSGTAVRLFTMTQEFPGTGKLRFNVILSLAHIQDAQGALRVAILLPVLVAVLLGTAIAFWLSNLITNPIRHLITDITEVSNGNLNHQTHPHSTDEVGLLATTFNRMTTALRAAHQQEIEAKALEHDLEIASEIQSNLVPKRMLKIPGYDISAYYRPSKEVGGDYYDFIEIDENNEGFIVADVSGKGIPGSLVMTMARAFIRMEAERSRNTSPGDTLSRANRMLAQDIKKGMFVTAMYGILNKQTNQLRVASAGHNPMVVVRGNGQVQLVNPNGIALGFDKGPVFDRSVKEEVVTLGHGDRIVAFTDGTVEAMSPDNQEFGDKRFYQMIQQLSGRDSNQLLNLLVKAIDDHRGNAPQSDDITIVTMRRL
ncbi:MAG TPA: SpoIIE family protein phosphatase [Planctomycetota bacterium]|nr:SpoIIE family protein phosphatase [Planctomycetota bacterium]